MNEKFLTAIGAVFLLFSGMIYTFERNFSLFVQHIELLGFRIANINGAIPIPKVETSNFFVWLFLLIGSFFLLQGMIQYYKNK